MKIDWSTRTLYVTPEEYRVILNYALATSATSEVGLTPILRHHVEASISNFSGVQVVVDEEKAKSEELGYYQL